MSCCRERRRCQPTGQPDITFLRKCYVEDFVREILAIEGFPADGWVRYVYYHREYLLVTDPIPDTADNIFWNEDQYVVFVIESKETFAKKNPDLIKQLGLSENSKKGDWVNAYLKHSFENWKIEDYY